MKCYGAREAKPPPLDGLYFGQSNLSDAASSRSRSSSPTPPAEAGVGAPGNLCYSAEQRLQEFFPIGNVPATYSDLELQQMSRLLRNMGRGSWSKVPRLYTILRIIGQLQLLDSFIDQGITDIWFPSQKPPFQSSSHLRCDLNLKNHNRSFSPKR